MEYQDGGQPELGAVPTGHIHRNAVMQSAIMSGDIEFHADQDTEFVATVPEVERVPNHELPEGTIDISDSAMGVVVIGSEDAKVDMSGTRTNIKIERPNGVSSRQGVCQPESDATPWYDPTPRPETGVNSSNSVILNTVVGSSDTKINMEGAKINIKRKKKSSSKKAAQPGHININNSVALGLVANSRGTEVILKDANINIE